MVPRVSVRACILYVHYIWHMCVCVRAFVREFVRACVRTHISRLFTAQCKQPAHFLSELGQDRTPVSQNYVTRVSFNWCASTGSWPCWWTTNAENHWTTYDVYLQLSAENHWATKHVYLQLSATAHFLSELGVLSAKFSKNAQLVDLSEVSSMTVALRPF